MAFDKMTEINQDNLNGLSRPNGTRSFFRKYKGVAVGVGKWCLIDQGLPDIAFHLQVPTAAAAAAQAQIEVSYDDPNIIINGGTPTYAVWPNGKVTGTVAGAVADSQWAGKCVRAWRLNVLVNTEGLSVYAVASI